jgi:glycosyltransferase involved in cell wall biosynthesis
MKFEHFWRAIQGAIRECRRWSKISNSPNSVRVYYGYEHIPSVSELTSGGIVKFQDLIKTFPNTLSNPNILYIASSSLLPYTVSMAKSAKRAGAKVVINQNGVAYPAWHGQGWEITNKPIKMLLSMADYVFYQSEFCKISADHFLGDVNVPFEILYNPVDTNVFRPKLQPDSFNELILLAAGSHTRRYRITNAIDAFVALVGKGIKVKLVVAGKCCWQDEKISRAEAKDYAKARGVCDKVKFTGPYSQQDAVPIFQSAHILLHTQYNDSCPRLVVEAMACGLPVVYSASGGVPELVGSMAGEGVYAPLDWEKEHPPNPVELADCVMKIMSNYKGYSDNARKRAVDYFDVKPWVMRHQAVFENLLKS